MRASTFFMDILITIRASYYFLVPPAIFFTDQASVFTSLTDKMNAIDLVTFNRLVSQAST